MQIIIASTPPSSGKNIQILGIFKLYTYVWVYLQYGSLIYYRNTNKRDVWWLKFLISLSIVCIYVQEVLNQSEIIVCSQT